MSVWRRVGQVIGAVVGIPVRRRRQSVAVVVALLLTGDGEVFALNAVGIGIGAVILRRLARLGRGGLCGDR